MTAQHDRDRSVDELLRRSLRVPEVSSDGESCLDAERLAAWIDDGLNPNELARAEAHLAGCARCQATIAAIGRSVSPSPAPAPWWRRNWRLGWLVPLTAGAAAIGLWIAVPQEPPGGSPAPLSQLDRAQTPTAPVPSFEASAPGDRVLVAPADEGERRSREVASQGQKAEVREDRKAETRAIQRPAAVQPDTANRVAGSQSAGAAAEPTRAESMAASLDRASALSRRSVGFPVIASPDSKILWRIGARGSVQHTTNGGASWEDLVTGVTVDLTAGSSPSASVCWLVGRAGTVLRTTDARRWQRLPFPEAVDLTAVQATDDRTASVTATDGRVFRTADGGSTWNLSEIR